MAEWTGDTVTVSTSNMVFFATGLRVPQTGPFTAHLHNFERSIVTADVALGVPEPSILALLGAGLFGLAYRRRATCLTRS